MGSQLWPGAPPPLCSLCNGHTAPTFLLSNNPHFYCNCFKLFSFSSTSGELSRKKTSLFGKKSKDELGLPNLSTQEAVGTAAARARLLQQARPLGPEELKGVREVPMTYEVARLRQGLTSR